MREECKYFQRRVHASGDVTQFCALDLAPEAPWRCPASCSRYVQRVGAGGPPGAVEEQREPALHPDAVALLSSAAEIVGAVGPEIAAERRRQREEEQRRSATWWARLRRRSSGWRR